MTWHVDGHLKGLLCFRVDDPEYDRVLQVNGIHHWAALENDNMQQCGSPTSFSPWTRWPTLARWVLSEGLHAATTRPSV